MNIQKSLDEIKKIQICFLEFIDDEVNTEENFNNLCALFDEQKIYDDKAKFKLVLHLISDVSSNHHHYPNFFSKIERILLIFKDSFPKHLTNIEIFHIFKYSKRILLFLLEEKLFIIDDIIAIEMITKHEYTSIYFTPELKPFSTETFFCEKCRKECVFDDLYSKLNKEIPDDFYELRKIGENPKKLAKMIREDSIKDFISYLNQTNLSVDSDIDHSREYETNTYLLKSFRCTFSEYSAFFGSIQILNYIIQNKAKLEPYIWDYSMHSNNIEIIKLLEKNHVDKEVQADNLFMILFKQEKIPPFFMRCSKEAIKCHHNEITKYLLSNYQHEFEENFESIIIHILKYHNYELLKEENINESLFCYLYKYDYTPFVLNLLKTKNVDVNQKAYGNKDKETWKTVLYMAIEKEDFEFVKLLLNNDKIDVNITSKGNTDAFLRYHYDNNPLFETKRVKWEKTALYLSIEKNYIEIIELLLNNNKCDISILNTEFSTMIFIKYFELDNLNYSNITNYIHSIKEEDEHKIYQTESYNIIFKKTAFCLAIENRNLELIHLLLKKDEIGINVLNEKIFINYENYRSIGNNSTEYKWRKSLLFLAIENNDIEIIKLLLNKNKLDINLFSEGIYEKDDREKWEKTVLYLAIEKENPEIVSLLLGNNEIDVNIINKENGFSDSEKKDDYYIYPNVRWEKTALFLAIEKENVDIVNLLFKNDKIDVNSINKEFSYTHHQNNLNWEKTALFLAVEKENVDIVNLLLKNDKIDVNILSECKKERKTPLHLAVEKENIKIISILMTNKNINANAEDEKGRKPIDCTSNDEIKKLINH